MSQHWGTAHPYICFCHPSPTWLLLFEELTFAETTKSTVELKHRNAYFISSTSNTLHPTQLKPTKSNCSTISSWILLFYFHYTTLKWPSKIVRFMYNCTTLNWILPIFYSNNINGKTIYRLRGWLLSWFCRWLVRKLHQDLHMIFEGL